jgi:hypothetical protein
MLMELTAPLQRDPAIRVIIPCSRSKVRSLRAATQLELNLHRDAVRAGSACLSQPARDLYTGRAFRRAAASVDAFAAERPDLPIALHIASAEFGIVEASQLLVPYEAVMGSGPRQWAARGRQLGMPEAAKQLIESCDLAIFALSQPYATGAGLRSIRPNDGRAVVIGVSRDHESSRLRAIVAGRRVARALATSEREVAAVVLGRLLSIISADNPGVARRLPSDPLLWAS